MISCQKLYYESMYVGWVFKGDDRRVAHWFMESPVDPPGMISPLVVNSAIRMRCPRALAA